MSQNVFNCSVSEEANWGEVVRKSDCSVLNPLELDKSIIVVLTIICAFGFPLNFEIIYRIVYDKVLRSQSRYVIQLFSTTSSLATFFTIFVQICYFFLRRFDQASEHLCHLFTSIVGLSYGTFFLNLLASLIDSFVSTNFSNWHKKKVTPGRVVFCLSVLNLALIVAMKWVFISQSLPLVCALQSLHAVNLEFPILFLFISSIFFLFLNLISVWRLLPRASKANSSSNGRHQQPEGMEMREMPMSPAPPPVAFALAVISAAVEQQSIESTGDDDHSCSPLNQLELMATKMFLFTIIPLLLLPLPPIIFVLSCFYSSPSAEYCHDITLLINYSLIVFCLFALVYPIMNLWLNEDFAPPCSLRRFPMYLLISFWSFSACFLSITILIFTFYRIPQSFTH